MARYWWVNHDQTYDQEVVEGGYIWAPKTEANGNRSHFYDNLARVSPGDRILSYAGQRIKAIGEAQSHAMSAAKPSEFGLKGVHWNHEGWVVPVAWSPVVRPIRPKTHLHDLRPHLEKKYAPIRGETGNGNQKAYLCEVSEALYSLVVGWTGGLGPDILSSASRDQVIERIESEVQKSLEDTRDLSSTEREQSIKARKSQGAFRRNVEANESACRVSGVSTPSLLVASHIKPWRSCRTAAERLDGNNGLLLAYHVDRLFDIGLIGFGDDGEILVSQYLDSNDVKRMGLAAAFGKGAGAFSKEQGRYLSYHRKNVFVDGLLM